MANENKTINVINYIRQNASEVYKERVPILNDKGEFVKFANPLKEYSIQKNEFFTGLINVIGDSILNRINKFENPLAKFKRKTNGLGIDVREIASGLVEGMDFEFTTEGIAKMFKLYPTEYAECFHRLKRRRIFPITISKKEMAQALNSFDDLENLINDKVNTLYESNYQEEYIYMIELLRSSAQNNNLKIINVDEVTNEESGITYVETVKDIASSFKFRDRTNSAYGNDNENTKILPCCGKEDIALILPYTIKNRISTRVLASAFNKDEVAFNVDNVTEVDFLGYIKRGVDTNAKYYQIDGFVCDKNFIRVLDDPDNGLEENNLPTVRAKNSYLHVWQTLSTSPFVCCNVLAHEVEESVIPEGYFDNLIENGATITD